MTGFRVGIDVGGTFTDFTVLHETDGNFIAFKSPSQPSDPHRAILQGLTALLDSEQIRPAELQLLTNGTTIGLNTVIQRSGARTGLLVTKGFRDVLELRRVRLPGAPSFYAERPVPLVPRRHVVDIEERVLANGRVYRELDLDEVDRAVDALVAEGIEALAICFLHAYRDALHERAAAARVRERHPDLFTCASHEIWPQQREYERALVTTVNAFVGPVLRGYYERLDRGLAELGVACPTLATKSNGGVMSCRRAADVPVETLLSGPASGVVAAAQIGQLAGFPKLIALDMGGTSADIAVIDGDIAFSTESQIGDFPIFTPAIDLTSIGAGGGSIAWVDPNGVLKVGPRSAGAAPGPACYGMGGEEPTVTDAYVVAGIVDPAEFLGGTKVLERPLADAAVERLGNQLGLGGEAAAVGVLHVATANMYAQFLPLMAQHGVDHREFAILAYGGAGPTHAFLLADEVGIRTVVVPPSPGTLCALGSLLADLRADFVRTVYAEYAPSLLPRLESVYAELEAEAQRWLFEEREIAVDRRTVRWADVRYLGQSFEVRVTLEPTDGPADLPDRFHARHQAIYGYSDPTGPVEIIDVRVTAIGTTVKPARLAPAELHGMPPRQPTHPREVLIGERRVQASVHRRHELRQGQTIDGPALVVQYDTTVFAPPGWRLEVDEWQNLVGRRH
ncbi:MAG: hydantoinase/oxoprolinase family protein [Chloroflexi bacterium]|nr:hydantoinase/oxoprolinase family protein [Chloroflexota bacterium]